MKIAKVYDANAYINNTSVHGLASEVTLPNVTAIMNDYKSLAMIGKLKLFNGFDAMEAVIKWTYPDNAAQKACANFLKPVDVMIRSSKAEYDNGGITNEVPIVAYMKGYSQEHQGGSFKNEEDTEVETTLSVHYFKLEIDGEPIIEVDVLNNIYKVDGEDLLAERRENLGI